MSWSQKIIFDNGFTATGGLALSFARNVVTVAPSGASIAVDTPRYDDRERAVTSFVTWTQALASQGGLYYVLATGFDTDGVTPLCVTWSASTGVIRCHRGDSLTLMYQSGNIHINSYPDLMAGSVPNYRVAPGYGFILDGTIVLYGAVGWNGGAGTTFTTTTTSLVYSTNYGQTWTIVEAVGQQFLTPVTGSSGIARGERWCIKHPMPVTVDGTRMLSGWIAYTDYVINAPSPGGQVLLCRVSRESTNAPWTFGKLRTMFEKTAAGCHAHTAGAIERDGTVYTIGVIGDTAQNEIVVIETDAATYETADLTVHRSAHGSETASNSSPRALQCMSLTPHYASQSFFAAPDNHNFTVARVSLPDPFVGRVVCEKVFGELSSGVIGTDTFIMDGRPSGPYMAIRSNAYGGATQGAAESSVGYWSTDGSAWAEISSPALAYSIYGDRLLTYSTSGQTLSISSRPTSILAARPMLVSAGGTNQAWFGTGYSGSDTGSVNVACGGTPGAWTWPAESGRTGLIDPQPPCRGPCYYYRSAGVSRIVIGTSNEWDAGTAGTKGRTWRGWLLMLRDGSEPGIQHGQGGSFTPVWNRAVYTNHRWEPLIACKRAATSGGDWHQRLFSSNNDAITPDVEWLFCHGEKIEDQLSPYPLPFRTNNTTPASASPHEIAAVTGLSVGATWTVAVRMMVPEDWWDARLLFTVYGAAATVVLFTIYTDTNNYAEVTLTTGAAQDDLITVQAKVYVGGALDTTIDLGANFWFNAGTTIFAAFSFDGTNLSFRFRSNGDESATAEVAATSPAAVRFSNKAQNAVVPVGVFDVRGASEAMSLTSWADLFTAAASRDRSLARRMLLNS